MKLATILVAIAAALSLIFGGVAAQGNHNFEIQNTMDCIIALQIVVNQSGVAVKSDSQLNPGQTSLTNLNFVNGKGDFVEAVNIKPVGSCEGVTSFVPYKGKATKKCYVTKKDSKGVVDCS